MDNLHKNSLHTILGEKRIYNLADYNESYSRSLQNYEPSVMVFVEQFNVLLLIFCLSGLKPIETMKKWVIIPGIVTSVMGVILTTHLAILPHLTSYGLISVLIYYGSLLPSLLIILTANGQCYLYKDTYHSITNRIAKLENMLKEKTLRQLIQKVAIRYRLKVAFIYILLFLSQGLVIAETWYLDPQHLRSAFVILSVRATHPMHLFHFVLYINIVAMFFQVLNEKIRNSPASVLFSSKIEFLKYIKLMYMDLWKLVRLISNFFGLNLLFITLYLFIYITHQVYWIFLNTHAKLDVLGLLEGFASLFYGVATLLTLVNSCESCLSEIKKLIENIEQYTFWTADNVHLHHLKQEIFNQITHFPIHISPCDLFTIDRRFFAGTVASCCMYIVIFIQFFQAAET